MVILKNTRRKRFQFTLYHDQVCRRAGKCFCVVAIKINDSGKRVSDRRPASVQIDGGKESKPLPDEVFHVPQVRAALRKGGFLTRRFVEEKAPAPAVSTKTDKPKKSGK